MSIVFNFLFYDTLGPKKSVQGALKFIAIRSDIETESRNIFLETFCKESGISRQFLAPRTPQQNGVVNRKNRFQLKL